MLGVAGLATALWAGQEQGDPRLDYLLQCQGCHGASASGHEAFGVPDLAGSVGRFVAVEGGRAYLVQVPGVAQAPLSDAATADLLNWLLVRFSQAELPEPFLPYDAGEVARHRSRTPIDVAATRAAVLERLGD